ncbi:MAG: type II secretion system protein [Thermoguttaceae bacterium]|nr:type II secretion system protein [Thermoguttaceae bacterium]
MKRLEHTERRPRRRAPRGDRSAFTLVELLVTISIIATLGAISITTVRSSVETARQAQTETTIAKIDSVLTSIYERYQYLRLDMSDLPNNISGEERARQRIYRMRDLMRRDLPCSPEELATDSQRVGETSTPLQQSYRAAVANSDGLGDNYNAELLYLVVTNADPEARAGFSDRDVADTDGNGLLEFVDGWGRPICWMRWAPGLESSDRQPALPLDPANAELDADPFDPLGVGNGWFLVPYVFSAGPDGEYGLIAPTATDVVEMNDPFTSTLVNWANGDYDLIPGCPNGDKTHKDNIDNHTLVR